MPCNTRIAHSFGTQWITMMYCLLPSTPCCQACNLPSPKHSLFPGKWYDIDGMRQVTVTATVVMQNLFAALSSSGMLGSYCMQSGLHGHPSPQGKCTDDYPRTLHLQSRAHDSSLSAVSSSVQCRSFCPNLGKERMHSETGQRHTRSSSLRGSVYRKAILWTRILQDLYAHFRSIQVSLLNLKKSIGGLQTEGRREIHRVQQYSCFIIAMHIHAIVAIICDGITHPKLCFGLVQERALLSDHPLGLLLLYRA